ncbi:hypothetical protein [Flavobacterium agrisoli]|uniref:Uncharacterized protein n=1 Tax=Flavobacterium agrisoli TaxID=2793066 RepID=A0A934PNH4_9FLAO|nr:hypothetical protein [Flavobacterium agrisoli]MBK0370115.1 hypothetical protein [Flavobacterium agrisoli]
MMKKIVFTALFLGMVSFSQAQNLGDLSKSASASASKAASSATSSFDVAGISNQIMGVLNPKLKLTEAQKPMVNSLVNDLLNKKKSILPKAVTDKAGYAAGMKGINDTFTSKMKGLVNASQYTSLLGILPKSASSVSPLAKMLF